MGLRHKTDHDKTKTISPSLMLPHPHFTAWTYAAIHGPDGTDYDHHQYIANLRDMLSRNPKGEAYARAAFRAKAAEAGVRAPQSEAEWEHIRNAAQMEDEDRYNTLLQRSGKQYDLKKNAQLQALQRPGLLRSSESRSRANTYIHPFARHSSNRLQLEKQQHFVHIQESGKMCSLR